MLPVIALVGRPNVGKSTLFNQLTKSRDALVADFSGLTRDRKYGEACVSENRFIVIDTGGLGEEELGIDIAMAKQSVLAIEESDLVFLIVDAKAGITPGDISIASFLRSSGKTTIVVANKIDGINPEQGCADFYSLGFDEVIPVAAVHGRGVSALVETAFKKIPDSFKLQEVDISAENEVPSDNLKPQIKVAVVGRPNVGKSTLVNRMLGEERVLVYDMPGTTRDSIYINFIKDDNHFVLIDTAGIRKRKNIDQPIEKYSIVKTLQAIADAHVVILVIDAQEGLVEQDMHLMGHVLEKGRALVVAVNKWDGLDPDRKAEIKAAIARRLQFADFAEIHYISALHGSGVGTLYPTICMAYESANRKLSTSFLTRLLSGFISLHQPPLVRGRRIKLRYAHSGGHNPPIVVIHGNQVDQVPEHYKRYLEKSFREALGLAGTPLRIEFKSGENPYKGKKNTLTARQIQKRKRLLRHTKRK